MATQPQKEWNNAICSKMDGPRDYHTKWSQAKREISWYYFYVDSKIWHKLTDLWMRKRLTNIDNEFMVIKMERGCGKDIMGVWD